MDSCAAQYQRGLTQV